ncbi:MAG: serine protease [bacterium]|jgi:S1-C subfamily serine protease|nr:serine protease [candidate division KSB1 bacterium]MDH7561381.1 serine protease [bacterium]
MKLPLAFCLAILVGVTLVCSCARMNSRAGLAPQPQEERVRQLALLEPSLVKITCSAYYRNYTYARPGVVDLPVEQKLTSSSVAGSGLVLLQNSREMLVLTCNHVVDFADTIRHYFLDDAKRPTNHLRQLSIKYRQDIFVFHRSGEWTAGELVAADRENDIALLKTSRAGQQMAESPLPFRFGDAGDLKLGQEVYVLGFPKGFFAVTRGLVSPSRGRGRFMLDIAFNRGYSGGVVVHPNEREGRMEYVGMATSAAYDSHYLLAPPADTTPPTPEPDIPYTGDIYVEELKLINYGITFVVSSNTVRNFLRANLDLLQRNGFSAATLLK